MENYSFYQSSLSPLNDEIKFSRADSFPEFLDFFRNFFRLKYAARQAITKHMENYSFYKSSLSPLNDEIKFSRADSSQNSGEAAEGFKYLFFVDFFPNIQG